jgi:hypothetical protein
MPYENPEPGSVQDIGIIVGQKAHLLFPGGVLVDVPPWEHARAAAQTAGLVKDSSVPAIFEAAFEADGIRIKVDILERLPRGRWGLREVKSSRSVKEEHLDDVAIQMHVLERAGINVTSAELIHVNSDYVLGKKGVDWPSFFARADMTREAKGHIQTVMANLARLTPTLGLRSAPDIETGKQCGSPYPCEFYENCTADKPDDWVAHLPRISEKRLAELKARGTDAISKIPKGFELTSNQDIVRNVIKTGKPYYSDRLKDALRHSGPPAVYLDFETMSPLIPLYLGTSPGQRIPFQWSLHTVNGRGALEHAAFLADGKNDPRLEFAETLIDALADGEEPVIVYSGFEKSVLGELKGFVPKKLAAKIDRINRKLFDLLAVVRSHVYHAGFDFSYSIKNVAPVLAPEVRYDDLDLVADGGAASAAFHSIASGAISNPKQTEKVRAALLEYCRRDTLAMVGVHEALSRKVR